MGSKAPQEKPQPETFAEPPGEGFEGFSLHITPVVVGVSGKDNAKCWNVDGTHAPERAGRGECSADINITIGVKVHAILAS